ncbi:MAG TPA: DUF4412 domain-containing protein [Prolixibacteraceae bacterium]|nr:DUF4412 domain-containing protein [Prolixibacteraceae bacterium]
MKKLFLFFILLLGISVVAPAQILRGIVNRAANSAANKAEEKVGDEVEKQVDKQVSKFFDNMFKEDSTQAENEAEDAENVENEEEESMPRSQKSISNFMNSFGTNTPVTKKDTYRFTSQIVMLSEGTDADGNKIDPVDYIISYNDDNSDMLFAFRNNQGQESTIIVDTENKVSLILSNEKGNKTGIATKFDVEEGEEESASSSGSETEVSDEDCYAKTGKSRTINGYSCKEYRCETDEDVSSIWVTNDLNRKYNNIFARNPMGGKYKNGKIEGMVIEWTYRSKTDQSSSVMTVKSFDPKKSSSFSTEGYEIMSFSMKVN